jgi:hypothetical protein
VLLIIFILFVTEVLVVVATGAEMSDDGVVLAVFISCDVTRAVASSLT